MLKLFKKKKTISYLYMYLDHLDPSFVSKDKVKQKRLQSGNEEDKRACCCWPPDEADSMAAAADEGPPTLPAPLIQLLGPLFRDGSADSSFGIGRGPLLAPYKLPNCDGSLEWTANNNGVGRLMRYRTEEKKSKTKKKQKQNE